MTAVSITESLLGSSFAVHIEGVRIRKDVLVPISRLCGGDDTLAGFYKLGSNCDILVGHQRESIYEDETYLVSDLDINFGDATSGKRRCGVEPTELLNKQLCK